MTSGLHHITAITRRIQANVDFYVGFLGLRLIKRTAGFEDATQLHLFYGDARGTPGSIVTFLAWEDGSQGRVGHGAPSEIAFAIPRGAIGFWLTRALQFGLAASGPGVEFGEPVLRLADPDGIIVKLVGTDGLAPGEVWAGTGIPKAEAILRVRGVTLLSEHGRATEDFLVRHAGFRPSGREGAISRLVSDSQDVIDVRDAGGFWPAAPGTGTIDHVAVRMPDKAAVEALAHRLAGEGEAPTTAHDRKYFYSLYAREPAGTLVEFATDQPGFAIDEPLEHLGERLFVPQHSVGNKTDILAMLPQFGLPGEPRIVYRDLPFVHRIHEPDANDGSALILLAGTGGNEATLLPLGRRLAPNATLIGVRGRSTEEGSVRFFRRFSDTVFDQADIRAEAEAFAAFVAGATAGYGLDPARLAFAGYSNGANLLGAAMFLEPATIRTAVLLRPMAVLEDPPQTSLAGLRVLLVTGSSDPHAAQGETLAEQLRTRGAEVTLQAIDAGHELSDDDVPVARAWLKSQLIAASL